MLSVALFGASGQLGRTFLNRVAERASNAVTVQVIPRSVDISDESSVRNVLLAARPDWILNAAAMTDVDGAQVDPGRALEINALGPAHIARCATEVGSRFIHISTEAVFGGEIDLPYSEAAACLPVSAYGVTKLAGELLAAAYMHDSFVLRTSWLYSATTGMNFPTRIRQQLADPDRTVSVVTDIVGNPTPTVVLADAILAIMGAPPDPGIYHVCCLGAASKYEWALEIAQSSGHDRSRIHPVTSAVYSTAARRPKHVDLDCTKFQATGLMVLPEWRRAWSAIATDPIMSGDSSPSV